MKIFDNFRMWLGEGRFWALVGMLVVTGIASLVLQFLQIENAIVTQNALVAAFVLGAILIIGSRMDVEQRGRWAAILVPSFGLVILGVVFFPQYLLVFMGAAFGWAVVALFLFGNSNLPMQYRKAIKAMRDNDYETAVKAMDELIREDSDTPNHYRFRAELLRLWGKLGRARRDYEIMITKSDHEDDLAVAYNGLAEVELQSGNYSEALVAAQKAYELAPDEWVASYNLGMIADRLGDNKVVIENLERTLEAGVPDSRHRLLVHLWQARAYLRQGDKDSAQTAINNLQDEKRGLKEWQKILPDEQASVLRAVLSEDVELAEALLSGERTLDNWQQEAVANR
ncbi:MAG: tetratricopeptide repeat protein [Chloroflexota bacterium]